MVQNTNRMLKFLKQAATRFRWRQMLFERCIYRNKRAKANVFWILIIWTWMNYQEPFLSSNYRTVWQRICQRICQQTCQRIFSSLHVLTVILHVQLFWFRCSLIFHLSYEFGSRQFFQKPLHHDDHFCFQLKKLLWIGIFKFTEQFKRINLTFRFNFPTFSS